MKRSAATFSILALAGAVMFTGLAPIASAEAQAVTGWPPKGYSDQGGYGRRHSNDTIVVIDEPRRGQRTGGLRRWNESARHRDWDEDWDDSSEWNEDRDWDDEDRDWDRERRYRNPGARARGYGNSRRNRYDDDRRGRINAANRRQRKSAPPAAAPTGEVTVYSVQGKTREEIRDLLR